MFRIPLWPALFLVATWSQPIWGADPQTVGELGDPQKIIFRGNERYTADDLRIELSEDPDFLEAAHRLAPLDRYLAVLQTRIRDGYRHLGYDRAMVEAVSQGEPPHVLVTITEGPRFRQGEIRVRGAKALPADDIIRALTSLRPDDDNAVSLDPDQQPNDPPAWIDRKGLPTAPRRALWKTGDIASFSTQSDRLLEAVVRREYREIGRRGPKFDLSYEKEGNAAHLVVDVKDEGPAATISKIAVAGNKNNTDEELIRFLNVRVGEVFDRRLQTRLERALWNSARFSKYRVDFDSERAEPQPQAGPDAPAGSGRLLVDIEEFKHAPKLSEKHSPAAEALLKFREWLRTSADRGDELVLHFRAAADAELDMVMAPGRGLLVEGRMRLPGDDEWRSYVYEFGGDTTTLYALHRNECFTFTPAELIWIINARWFVINDEKNPFQFFLGLGARTPRYGAAQRKLQLQTVGAPVYFAAMAYAEHLPDPIVCRIVDGDLVYTSFDVRLRIDAASGAPRDLGFVKPNPQGPDEVSVRVERGAFEARRKALAPKLAACRNRYDPRHGPESAVRFLIDDPTWADMAQAAELPEVIPAARLARKALDADLAAPLDTLLEACFGTNNSKFALPSPDGYRTATLDGSLADLAATLRVRMPVVADRYFSRDTWVWTLTREFGLASVGRSRYLADEFARAAEAQHWGPLAEFCAAAGAAYFQVPEAVGPAMARGAKRLGDAELLRADCRALLSPDHEAGRLAENFGKFVRGLDDEEAAFLTDLVDQPQVPLAALVRQLRASEGKPPEQVWAQVFEKAISDAISSPVAERPKNRKK